MQTSKATKKKTRSEARSTLNVQTVEEDTVCFLFTVNVFQSFKPLLYPPFGVTGNCIVPCPFVLRENYFFMGSLLPHRQSPEGTVELSRYLLLIRERVFLSPQQKSHLSAKSNATFFHLLSELLMSSLLLNPNKALFTVSSSSPLRSNTNAQILVASRRAAARIVDCRPRASRGSFEAEALPETNTKKKNTNRKIILFGSSPPPLTDDRSSAAGNGSGKPGPEASSRGFFQKALKRALAVLSNLPLAIAEMFAIAALMALGTVIDQGEAPDYYFQKFPEENPMFGFFTWRWVLTLGFDHMFTSPVFLGLLILLASSLMACTYTTQIPLVKVARRWSFMHSAEAIRKQDFADSLPKASVEDLGIILMGAGYEVFLKGPSLYAFKGMAGRLAPIGVHLSMLLIMVGGTLSAAGSFHGSVTVPQGLNFVVGDTMNPNGFLSFPTQSFDTEVHVNRFYMDYYESGEVSQFYTDLSLFSLDGKELMRKTIRVNDPLRFRGITIYQTDWGFSALQITKNGEGPFNLAMAPLQMNGEKKLFGTFLPTGNADSPNVKGISMLARDLQSIVLYDQEGKFAGVRRPSSKLPIDIDGTRIVIEDAIGSTGLDLKTDPGVAIVYAGFGALMLTTCISYFSHSQIWALQDGTTVVIGGKTNRAKLEFRDEANRLLDRVPELVTIGQNLNG